MLAFVVASLLETKMDALEPILPNNNECQIRICNAMHYSYISNFSKADYHFESVRVSPLEKWQHTFNAKKITNIVRRSMGEKQGVRHMDDYCSAVLAKHFLKRISNGKMNIKKLNNFLLKTNIVLSHSFCQK